MVESPGYGAVTARGLRSVSKGMYESARMEAVTHTTGSLQGMPLTTKICSSAH